MNASPEGRCYGCGEYDGCICAKLRAEEEEARYMEGLEDDEPDDEDEDDES